ncbi:MAG: MGMT family protein [Chloroflexota bacterium]|nr:MGMT family protein [Chloroflexota bacterium]MDE2909339.1 MGMT family protein [Chloroflexota bacterium]
MFYPPQATSFFETVWEIVRQIPAGKVSSYGQIASMIAPGADIEPTRMRNLAPRWVGTALRKTPSGKSIPWHRVINSRGTISFPAGSAQAEEQRRLLEMEGVGFDKSGKVDFAKVGWQGPDDAYLQQTGLLPPRLLK